MMKTNLWCFLITAKHEEKQDEHGFISRQFSRKYILPEECNPDKTTCTFSPEGVLTVTSPLKPVEKKEEKSIKIEFTEKPSNEKENENENLEEKKVS